MNNNDIVARLRVWSDWLNERCPDTEVRNDLRAAAAEIERLREELTASHESHGNEVGALTERLSLAIHERDEARREVCRFECEADTDWIDSPFPMQQSTPRMFAMLHGWDCFKEARDERHC